MINSYGQFTLADYDARLEGHWFTAPKGTSIHYINFTEDCFFNGLEIGTSTNEYGSTINISTEYYVPPLTTWKRYKKFGKNFCLFPNTTNRVILFPTTPQAGVRLKIEVINNNDADDMEVGINLFKFVDIKDVDTSNAAEGEDW